MISTGLQRLRLDRLMSLSATKEGVNGHAFTASLLRAYESASGKKLHVGRLGSLEDLDAPIDHMRKAEPANMRAWLPLMYYRSVLNGEGKLDELMNDSYPSIRPTTCGST